VERELLFLLEAPREKQLALRPPEETGAVNQVHADFHLLDALAGVLVAGNIYGSSMCRADQRCARGIPAISGICALDHMSIRAVAAVESRVVGRTRGEKISAPHKYVHKAFGLTLNFP
jgi:hypothetical protein